MGFASYTRYSNTFLNKNNIKVYNRNESFGINKTNSSVNSLKRSDNNFDKFNKSVLNNEHEISSSTYGDIKMANRPVRDPTILNSYQSLSISL